jgi:hypothetical protein
MTPPTGKLSEKLVAGHTCDVFEPSEINSARTAAIYLHNAQRCRLRDQPWLVKLCERHGLPIVAPDSGRSWWTDRICPAFDAELTAERHLLDNILPFIRHCWDIMAPHIGLFGSEMGGQGALRIAYKHPRTFPVVAAISPAIDFQLLFDEDEQLQSMYRDREAARQDTALLNVHPLNWPRHQFFCCDPADPLWWDSADRLQMKLASTGIPHESDLGSPACAREEYAQHMMPRVISFLVQRLAST